MSFKNSRDNLVANVAQQFSGLLIALIVPLLLSVGEYAQVTVVSVLIAFMPLADLGITIIYSRKLPALYNNQNWNEVATWNATISRFKLYSSLIFAALISAYYLQRYQDILNAILLFCFVVFSIVFSYVIANATVQSDFRYIRNLTIGQMIAKLTVLPGVWLLGVKGWFFGQLLSVLAVFVNQRLRTVLRQSLANQCRPDWMLVRVNIAQGVIFSMVATLWLQLASSGKLYAAFAYPEAIVAQYGLVGSIYQITIALSVAVFVPQTIKIYRLLEEDQVAAISYAFRLVIYSAPIFMIMSVGLTYIAPLVVEMLFPKYHVDQGLYAPLMLSLFNSAVMVTQGSLLIGFGKAKLYLTTVMMACALYFGYIGLLSPATDHLAAAIAQLLILSTYSIAMLLLVYSLVKDKIDDKGMVWLAAAPSVAAPLIYFMVFY